MTSMNSELEKIREKLNSMSVTEFDEMLENCGIMTIKPSIESDYVKCMRRDFSKTDMAYEKGQKYNMSMREELYNFELDNGQGAA